MADFAFDLTTDSARHLHFAGVDQLGVSIPLPGPASASVGDASVAAFSLDADGFGGIAAGVGVGQTTLTVVDGGITKTVSLNVTAPVLADVVITADAPVAK